MFCPHPHNPHKRYRCTAPVKSIAYRVIDIIKVQFIFCPIKLIAGFRIEIDINYVLLNLMLLNDYYNNTDKNVCDI